MQASIGAPTKFYSYCKTTMNAHKKSLQEHGMSKKHLQSANNKQIVVDLLKIDKFVKATLSQKRKISVLVELKIATYVAEHCSIKTVDHLSIIIKGLDEESSLAEHKVTSHKMFGPHQECSMHSRRAARGHQSVVLFINNR